MTVKQRAIFAIVIGVLVFCGAFSIGYFVTGRAVWLYAPPAVIVMALIFAGILHAVMKWIYRGEES